MPWTEISRLQYRRSTRSYASDLMDEEWHLIELFMPKQNRLGRPRTVSLRRVVDAMIYIAATGSKLCQFPQEFAPYSTVQGCFYRWRKEGRWAIINHALVMAAREKGVTARFAQNRTLSREGLER